MRFHLVLIWLCAAVAVLAATSYGVAWSSDQARSDALVLTRQGLIGLLALLLLAGAMLVLDRRVAAPLRAVTASVARAGRDLDNSHVKEVGTSEVAGLARAFNAMLDLRAGHEAQLLHQATHDRVTGLPNTLLLRDRLEHALRQREGVDLAVLCVGLERFRNVIDGFGHHVADRVLRSVATRVAAQLRPGDTLSRFGGDEFMVVCEAAGADGAVSVVERVQLCFDEPFSAGEADRDILLQASIGIAITTRSAGSADQLLREASTAMQQAKGVDGGWCLFTGESQERAARHLAVEHALRDALHHDELVVHYQPVLDVATGHTVGAEALVRWQHPTRGMVPPMEFIPIAEETGQISAIGAQVLTKACRQAAEWAAAGHLLRMSVNVSVGQLVGADFPDTVHRVLTETGLPAAQLCLEITESALVREDDLTLVNLARLRALGVHLSVDDFGTGYSSLAYLHQLPVDELKIDQSFIARLCVEAKDAHLVEAIVRMAHALDLAVVAEGVETGDQLEALADLRCQRAQGYLFAAPKSAQEFSAGLRAAGARAGAHARTRFLPG